MRLGLDSVENSAPKNMHVTKVSYSIQSQLRYFAGAHGSDPGDAKEQEIGHRFRGHAGRFDASYLPRSPANAPLLKIY